MRVAVTGAAGHLGRVVIRRLLDREGVRVVALDRAPVESADPRVEPVRCDVRDPGLDRWFAGCDALLHLAFVVERGARDERDAISSNVDGTTNAFRAAARAGVPHVVYTSSIASYGFHPENEGRSLSEDTPLRGNPEFYYSHSKAEVERFLDAFAEEQPQLAVCRLRPSGFLDSCSERGVAGALRGRVFFRFLGAADPLVHLTHQEDVARAVLLAMDRRARGPFNLATDDPLRLSEWGAAMGKRSLSLPRFTPHALGLLHRLGLGETPPGWFTTAASHPIVVDSGRARRELGWEPLFPTTAVVLRAVSGRPTVLASRPTRLLLGGAALRTRLSGDVGGGPLPLRSSLNLLLTGPHPSEWTLCARAGRLRVFAGLDPDASGSLTLHEEAFLELLSRPDLDAARAGLRGAPALLELLESLLRRHRDMRSARGWLSLPRRVYARAID